MSGNSHVYRADIDGLRALAVLPVILFHAFPKLLPGGFVGVDIFFVISGYLISSIIFRNVGKGSFSFTDFYMKRVNRIFPSLSLVLTACLVFGWFALYADEYAQLGKHTAAGAGFVANIILLLESGYFDTASEMKVLLHLWSLGIEEQFYLLWPVLILTFRRSRRATLLALLLVIAASFTANIYYIRIDPTVTFYSPVTRFWELAFGSLLAYKEFHLTPRSGLASRKHHLMSLAGLSLIVFSIIYFTDRDFPGWKALLPVIGAVLVIAAGGNAIINKHLLSNKLLAFVGLISYPLYLWHWPLFTYLRIINSGTPPNHVLLMAVILSFSLAILTYYVWEKPLRYAQKKGYTAIALTILVSLIGIVGYFIFSSGGIQTRTFVEQSKSQNFQLNTHNWKYITNENCLNRYPFPDAKDYKWFFCYMTKNEKPEILLLGNSYANHLYHGLHNSKFFRNKNILSIGTCVPNIADSSSLTGNHPCAGDHPGKQRELIRNIISTEKSIKLVIISGLFWKNEDGAEKRLDDYIEFIIDNGAIPIIFYPHVYPGFDTRACFARPFSEPVKSCHVGIKAYKEKVDGVEDMFARIHKKHPDVEFYNPNDLYCDKSGCNFVINNMPVFRDGTHFSFYGSDRVIGGMIDRSRVIESVLK
ncbi:acyltransferase family protein [Erwinia sorbitola]|uniref:Acyltransferase family protein n=1 Tax=Erwinia sorbitola TaxID=2681984 RepID=A0A6I6ERB2_9GAMM|nr:acyltransferase family protein [Erwinia sorbitola]QGU87649.1 acyltransferase family protein [Erwinia sorbitola]